MTLYRSAITNLCEGDTGSPESSRTGDIYERGTHMPKRHLRRWQGERAERENRAVAKLVGQQGERPS